jgi:acyl-CoA dehydrogenase
MQFTEEQAMLLESAGSFCAEQSPVSRVRAMLGSESGFDASVWQQMGELGWTGMAIPEAMGGSGLSLAEVTTIVEPMGRHMLATPYCSGQQFVQGLLAGGTPAQQLRYLPQIAGGGVASVAVYEEEGSWNLSALASRAQRNQDSLTLSGQKILVADALSAKVFLVSVLVDGAPAVLLLEREQIPPANLERETLIDETRRSYRLRLDGLQVDAGQVITGQAALSALTAIRNSAWLLETALAAGGIAACLNTTVDYLNLRTTFGRKIGSYQSLKHTCADILVGLERTRSHLYHAASLTRESTEATELEIALRMGKAQSSDSFVHAGDRAVQFHGGFGFTYECDAQLYLRRALWIQAAYGDSAHHRKALGELMLAFKPD